MVRFDVHSTLLGVLLALPAALGAQGPNPVNLWSVSLRWRGDQLVAGAPQKLTHDDGTNSQPSFTPDSRAIVFSATRDTGATARSEIYRYDFRAGKETRITRTPENENSPTVNARGEYMAVRWIPATLFREYGPWMYSPSGVPQRGILRSADTTGYYTPLGRGRFILTRPKSRNFTVALFDSATGTITDLDSGVPALPAQRMPGKRAVSYVVIDSTSGRHALRMYDLTTTTATTLGSTLTGRTAHAWLPDGVTVLMAKGGTLYARRATQRRTAEAWRAIAKFSDPDLRHASAYVVSPDGKRLILTSPKRVPLAVVLRDSLEAGRAGRDLLPMVLEWRQKGELATYDVTEGALSTLGDTWLARKQADDAVALHTIVTEVFPASYRAMTRLGDSHRAAGTLHLAIVAWQKALALNARATQEQRNAADSVDQKLKALHGK